MTNSVLSTSIIECPQVIEITSAAVQRCMSDFFNPLALAESPLAGLPFVQTRIARQSETTALQQGLALRQVLLDALNQLKPEDGEPNPQDPNWSAWWILNHRYVQERGQNRYENIAQLLTVSKSTYYRKLHEAMAWLVAKLRAMDAESNPHRDANLQVTSGVLTTPPLPSHECFVGRSDLIQHIKTQLSHAEGEQRTLGLWGLPGSGKTTLLVQLANDPDIRQLFPDGILWGSLGPNPNLVSLAHSWCRAMHVSPEALDDAVTLSDKTRLLHQAIANCRVLIVIDDVWDALKALPLKIRGPGIGLLFTSRFPDIAAMLAGNNILKVDELTLEYSINLLNAYAPYVVDHFSEQVRELATGLGGLPLALVIVGQFLQQASFLQQTRRIELAFGELRNTLFKLTLADASVAANGVAPSERTLQAVIAKSVNLLSPEARLALGHLSRLSHKPHTFSEEAALQITDANYEQLDELVNMGLLEVVIEQDSRYAIHQVIADYAQSRIPSSGAERAITRYYANWIARQNDTGEAARLELSKSTPCAASRAAARLRDGFEKSGTGSISIS
ncbi:MAG: hypothetical protein HC853_07935 [Anaerolineae bacterium]|nr:hypothetical protein [Anaerolineae bacterium]